MHDDLATPALKAISKTAFHSDWMLPLLLAIIESPGDVVALKSLASRLQVDSGTLSKGFHDLVRLGVLSEEKVEGQRTKPHAVLRDSKLWDWATELATRAD